MNDEPDPEPSSPPRYAGDVGLEGLIDAELGLEAPAVEEPQTLELDTGAESMPIADLEEYEPDDDEDDEPIVRPVAAAGMLNDDVGVRVVSTRPAEESFAEGRLAERVEAERDAEPSRSPYGLAAAAILVFAAAGFAVGLTGPRETSTTAVASVGGGGKAKDSGRPTPAEIGPRPSKPTPRPPADVASLVDDAERLYRLGRAREARSRVDTVLAVEPAQPRALVLRASLHIEDKHLDDALADATKATEVSPDLADAHLAVAVIQQEREAFAEASTAYARYLELAPTGIYAETVRRQLQRIDAKLAPRKSPP